MERHLQNMGGLFGALVVTVGAEHAMSAHCTFRRWPESLCVKGEVGLGAKQALETSCQRWSIASDG